MTESKTVDTAALEMLASKICHDLISPIGAIANGLELLEDMGPGALEEVTELISYSAEQASAKLKAYRIAYGAGGADLSVGIEDVYKSAEALVKADGKITQDWDYNAVPMDLRSRRGFCKTLMAVMLIAFEALPKGGTVSVAAENDTCLTVIARGGNAGFREGVADALQSGFAIESVDPRLVHPYITGLLARRYGLAVSALPAAPGEAALRIQAM